MDEVCFIGNKPNIENYQVRWLSELATIPSGSQYLVRVVHYSGSVFWDSFFAYIHRVLQPGSILELCDYSRQFSDLAGSPWREASLLFDSWAFRGATFNMLASPTIGDTLLNADSTRLAKLR